MRAAARLARAARRAALAGVPVALEELILEIEGLDAEGRGVAREPDGKVVFVDGALPGERAAVRIMTGGRRFDLGRANPAQGIARPPNATLPALRRLRRLRHAARRSRHADGRQAGLAAAEPGTHRQGAARAGAADDQRR